MNLAIGPFAGKETGETALYGFRWNSELDICSIKAAINLGHVRCKSPEMVNREVWATLLADNLIRATIAGATVVHNRQPRQISFTSACQYVLASWMMTSSGSIADMRNHCQQLLAQIASCEVANVVKKTQDYRWGSLCN